MSKESIPKEIEQLKKDWWAMNGDIKRKDLTINELKRKAIHSDKVLNLVGALLIELDAKRKEPGLLENLKGRLAIEILKAQTGMKLASGK